MLKFYDSSNPGEVVLDPRQAKRRLAEAKLTPSQWSSISPLKLHLGCGTILLDGYVNMDVMPISGIDVQHDITTMLLPWEDNQVDEIFMSDVLEHIHKRHHDFALGEWLRVLKPGGTVQIIGPNFEVLALSLIQDSRQIDLPEDLVKQYFGSPFDHYEAMSTAILSDCYEGEQQIKALHHWWILTGNYVAELLRRHGFSRAEVAAGWPPTEFCVMGVK